MADVTKSVAGRTVTFSANSSRADVWMRQRYGDHTVTYKTDDERQRGLAIALEVEGKAMNPPMTFETL